MPSDISIASNALILIGDEPISSFREAGAGARVSSNLYNSTRDLLLSKHPWSFAQKQQRLNRLAESPDRETGYQYAFQIPTEVIRIWRIQPHTDYEIIGNLIYSNQKSLLLTYVYSSPESTFPPHFVKALEYYLASDFAGGVLDNAGNGEIFRRKGEIAMAQAMAIDSSMRPSVAITDQPFNDVRFRNQSEFR